MKFWISFASFVVLCGCVPLNQNIALIFPVAETIPVGSSDDAADDPAIWINAKDPSQSRIIGTDKQAGLYVYSLDGQQTQFLPAGALNNVDLRQDRTIGDWKGDIIAASNRSDDTISLFEVIDGGIEPLGAIPSIEVEPYGLCMGVLDGVTYIFVAHKSGNLYAYNLNTENSGEMVAQITLATQLEGCVFDDTTQTLFVGEELRGVWKASFKGKSFSNPELIAEISNANGMKADVEGIAIYNDGKGANFLVVSSQGNNSFAVFENADGYRFLDRFAIASTPEIDGAEDTDGIEITATPMGDAFPKGVLVVQDGFNKPNGSTQNFKVIDWRSVEQNTQLDLE